MGKSYTDNRHPIAVRFDREQIEKIEQAVKLTGLGKQDVIRIGLSLGLAKLEMVNYNLPTALLMAAELVESEKRNTFMAKGGMLLREDPPRKKN